MMVDFFRRKMKAFIWLIVIAFVLSIFLIAGGSFFYGDAAAERRQQAMDEAEKRAAEEKPESELDFESTKPVATVVYKDQSEVISEGELNRAVFNAKRNNEIYRRSQITLQNFKTIMGPLILDNLVKERLVMLEADRASIDVGPEVEEAIKKNYERAGGKEQFLAQVNLTEASLRSYLERQLKQERIIRRMTSGKAVDDKSVETYYGAHQDEFKGEDGQVKPLTEVREQIVEKLRSAVTDDEVAEYYKNHVARWKLPDVVDVRHLMLDPASQRWQTATTVTTAEISEHYAKNEGDYKAPKKVKLAHILVDPGHESFTADATPTDDAVRQVFDGEYPAEGDVTLLQVTVPAGETSADRVAAAQTIEGIRSSLETGTLFSALAAEHATGPLEATEGKVSGVKPRQLEAALARAVRALEPGQISEIVSTEDGFHMVQLVERAEPAKDDPERESLFREKREEIATEIEKAKREKLAVERLEKLRTSIGEGEGKVEFAAAARENSHAGSAGDGGEIGVVVLGDNKDNERVAELGVAGFLDENITDAVLELKPGEISRPVKSSKGWHLVKLLDVLPSEIRPLDEVSPEIERFLRNQKARQAVEESIERIKGELSRTAEAGAKPRDFAAIVKEESDGSDAPDGGLWNDLVLDPQEKPALGDVVREEVYSVRQLNAKIIDALAGLEEGQVSEVVTFGESVHLFQLVSREAARYRPLDDAIEDEIREVLNPDVGDEELRAYFEEHREDFAQPATITLRHILVPDEESAEEVLQKALRGEDFAYLARTNSRDSSTRDDGGLIKGEVAIPAIREAVEQMQPGQVYPKLVKSHLGSHVIQLVSRDAAKQPGFEDVRSEIRQRLLPEKRERILKSWLEELENQAVVRKHFANL